MNERCTELCEAHVAFELSQWRGKTLEKRIKEDVNAFWSWAEDMTLSEFSSVDHVNAAARRLVLEMPLPEHLAEIIGNIAKHLIALPVNRETSVADVMDRELFDEGTELVIDLRDLREQLIHQAVNSPVYGKMVSELLYNGIRDYLTSENSITQKLPGVSSIINKGAGALSKRLPDLEKRLRNSIQNNMNRTIKQSEQFLIESLTDDRIRHISDELWDMIQDSPLSVADVLGDEEVDDLIAFGMKLWLYLRETDYLAELIEEGITHFFKQYGKKKVAKLLTMVGVNKKLLQAEALALVPPLITVADDAGFLEASIRRRFEPFYASKEATRLLT